MGYQYLLAHVQYTIPPAILLTALNRPLWTRIDTYKISFLITISVFSTIPWDNYLIVNRVWSYPEDAIIGPCFFSIPLEELFFFFIQTYDTTVFYLLCNKTTVHVAYLNEIRQGKSSSKVTRNRIIGGFVAVILVAALGQSIRMVQSGTEGTYMGLIGIWVLPFMLMLWSISYQHLLTLPAANILLPIVVPTSLLVFMDTMHLQRGTWVINEGTKLGIQPWKHMEIEELVFFIATNTMIVMGLVAFDYGLALPTAFPSRHPSFTGRTPFLEMMKPGFRAFFTAEFPVDEYHHISESISILKKKSRSFHTASAVFEGRLRLDLILLYSFCRAADDLIDDSPAPEASLLRLRELLDIAYSPKRKHEFPGFIKANFPEWAHAPLLSLPAHKIPRGPFDGLLDGFEMDMSFPGCEGTPVKKEKWPIRGEEELWSYCSRVAGTVGEMFFSLVMTHYPSSEEEQKLIPDLLAQAGTMGIALQLVNIARDIEKDSMIGRVYIPGTWLKEAGLTEEDIIADPSRGEVFRPKLLAEAEKRYQESIAAVEMLPEETRGGAKVAIECYMDIGRRMQNQPEGKARWKAGKLQRIFKAWKVMNQA